MTQNRRKKKEPMTDKQDKQEAQTQTGIRIPESWLEELDEIAKQMSRPGQPVTRSVAMRLAIRSGIGALKAEVKRR